MVSANPPPIKLEVPFGYDVTVRCTSKFDGTSYAFAFTLCDADGNVIVTKTVANGGIVVLQLSPTIILDCLVSRSDTESLPSEGPDYTWAVWRTNAGNVHKLAGGPWHFVPTPEVAVV